MAAGLGQVTPLEQLTELGLCHALITLARPLANLPAPLALDHGFLASGLLDLACLAAHEDTGRLSATPQGVPGGLGPVPHGIRHRGCRLRPPKRSDAIGIYRSLDKVEVTLNWRHEIDLRQLRAHARSARDLPNTPGPQASGLLDRVAGSARCAAVLPVDGGAHRSSRFCHDFSAIERIGCG